MLILQNLNGDYTAITTPDVAITDTLGSFPSLSFSFIETEDNKVAGEMMIPFTRVTVTSWESGQTFRILTTQATKVGKYRQWSVTAVHEAKGISDHYVEGTLTGTQSLQSCLNFIMPAGYNYVINDNFPNYYFSETFGENYADELLINRLTSDFGFEWYVRGKTFYIAKKVGRSRAFVFIDNYNCQKIGVSENYESIYTYIKGKANPVTNEAGNSTYQVVADYTSPYEQTGRFPRRQMQTYTSEDNLTYDGLVSKLKQTLTDVPQVQYTVEGVNFKKFTFPSVDYAIGNSGNLRDRFGIDVETRISSITFYPEDAAKEDAITFGNLVLDPIVWQTRNYQAFKDNVKIGRKLRSDLLSVENQGKRNAESMMALQSTWESVSASMSQSASISQSISASLSTSQSISESASLSTSESQSLSVRESESLN